MVFQKLNLQRQFSPQMRQLCAIIWKMRLGVLLRLCA
jgi:hypothetical protein